VRWHNIEHRHSGIRYATPEKRHAGEDQAILDARHKLDQAACAAKPTRWRGKTRDCSPIGAVRLNPERDGVVAEAPGTAESMRSTA